MAVIVFGLLPLLRNRHEVPQPELEGSRTLAPAAIDGQELVVVGDIPQEPLGFQFRPDLMAALERPAGGSRVVVVHAVTGMRGVGKTHLAAAYARARLADRWRLVAWVNGEDAATLLSGLAEVAAAWGLVAVDGQVAGRAVRHRLETDGRRCVLVFDNVNDPELLQPFLPVSGESLVIITSTQQSVTHLGASVPVEVFTEPEALAYLADRTTRDDDDGARAVAQELGWLPLALAQAAAVIVAQHLDYATYLARLRTLPVGELLVPVQAGQYPRGVAAAVLLSVQSVQAADDAQGCGPVMDLLAVLSPAGVRRPVLHALCRTGFPWQHPGPSAGLTAEATDRVLGRLAGASLLTFSGDGSSASAHRLVMRVTRERLVVRDCLGQVCAVAAQVLDELAGSLEESWHEDRRAVRDLIEQISALDEAARQCPADENLIRRMIQLRERAVTYLNELDDSAAQAITMGERLLADQERLLGSDHPDTLASRNNLAIAFQEAGRAAEAIPLFQQTLTDRERVLGPDNLSTLQSRGNLANAYRYAGHIGEAITLHEQNLADRKRVLGPDHISTLRSAGNLANAYRYAGRTDEAITLHEQNAADRKRILGPDHPETLKSRGNLANAYRDAGRTAEAITLHEQDLADRERILGPDHPDTLASRDNLATTYQNAGRTDEAISLHQRTLADQERVQGPDHPDTLKTRGDLANAFRVAGRTADAITLHEQNLADRIRVLGPDHPDTMKTRDNLAAAYQDAHTDEAVSLHKRTPH